MHRKSLALLGLICASITLTATACAGGGSASSGETMMAPDKAGADVASTTVVENREIIRNADISIRVDDVRGAAAKVDAIAASVDGRVSDENITAMGESESAGLTLRVPATSLDAALAQISALGTVESVSIYSNDVTSQAVDLDARIAALRTSVTRLQQLMAQATTAKDLVEIEKELSSRQADLDSLVAQRAALSESVALSTVSVWISPTSAASAVTPPGFLSGLQSGWNALKTLGATLITVAGFALPFLLALLVAAVPIVIVIVIIVSVRRRKT